MDSLNQFTPDAGFMTLFPCLLIYGVGLGFPSVLSVDVPLLTIPPQAQNSCSGLVSTGQNLGLSMGTGIMGVVLILGAVSGLREAINTYTPLNLSHEAFRANAEMYMQKIRIQGSKKVDKMNSSNLACETPGRTLQSAIRRIQWKGSDR